MPNGILPDAEYILLSQRRVLCRVEAGWRPWTGREVLAAAWHIQRALPLSPGGSRVWVLEVDEGELGEHPAPGVWHTPRELLTRLSEPEFRQLGTAMQVLEWARNHRFCGRCGHPTHMCGHERGMHCSNCGLTQYPRVSPCVIVLVTRGDEILLARHRRSNMPIYGCLAGFIEAGESAEEAVHREVLEEVNLRLHNLRYQGSEPWPFPHQLMLGYYADYLSGELRPDEQELVDVRWWPLDRLPQIPPVQSIAGRLIRNYVAHRLGAA